MIILSFICLTAISGFLYRLGGTKHGTLWRDMGVTVCFVLGLYFIGYTDFLYIAALLMFASLTTYNKWLGKLFGRKDNEVHAEGWAMTGFTYGLCALPTIFGTGDWKGFLIRLAVCTVFTCIWSEVIGDVKLEEGGRGAIIVGSLPLLLIH